MMTPASLNRGFEMNEQSIREDEQSKIIERLLNIQPSLVIKADMEYLRGWHRWEETNLNRIVRGETNG